MKRLSPLQTALLVLILSAAWAVFLIATASARSESGDAWWLAAWSFTFLLPLVFLDWRRAARCESRCLRRGWRALRGEPRA